MVVWITRSAAGVVAAAAAAASECVVDVPCVRVRVKLTISATGAQGGETRNHPPSCALRTASERERQVGISLGAASKGTMNKLTECNEWYINHTLDTSHTHTRTLTNVMFTPIVHQ